MAYSTLSEALDRSPFFQAGVAVGAHPGQLRDLLTAQAGNPAAAAVERHAGLLRAELGPPTGQELAHLGSVIHNFHVTASRPG